MKRILTLLCSCVLLQMGGFSPCFGQPAPASPPELLPGLVKKRIGELTVDRWPVPELVHYLSEQFQGINFVSTPDLDEEAIPRIVLRDVNLDEIFTAIHIATKGKVQATIVGERMVSFTRGQLFESNPSKPICRAFSLNHYLANRSPEEVETALKDLDHALSTCWSMLREANPEDDFARPNLNLHRATKLLIVVGQPEQVGVAEQLVNQLEGKVQASAFSAPEYPIQPYSSIAPSAPAVPKAPVTLKAPQAPAAPEAPVRPSTKPPGSSK